MRSRQYRRLKDCPHCGLTGGAGVVYNPISDRSAADEIAWYVCARCGERSEASGADLLD